MKAVYVTRDSLCFTVEVWPATVGIRKFHGCVKYGAAWQKRYGSYRLYQNDTCSSETLSEYECKERFGFYPGKGTAWYVNSRGKRTKVDIAFSG